MRGNDVFPVTFAMIFTRFPARPRLGGATESRGSENFQSHQTTLLAPQLGHVVPAGKKERSPRGCGERKKMGTALIYDDEMTKYKLLWVE